MAENRKSAGPGRVTVGDMPSPSHAPLAPATLPARRDDEVKLVELREVRLERVILVGVAIAGSIEAAERSIEELRRLATTAGAEVLDALVQRRERPDAGTFI